MNTVTVKCCRFVFVVIVLILQYKSFSQPTAGFTANPLGGCSPIVVHFTDQSTGNPTQWRWNLGNGVVSFLQNPSTTYFNPGTYNIKLVVSNAAGTDSIVKNQYITVYGSPVVYFAASDTVGCFPMTVHFTDQSSAVSGTITTWSWDFGDGSTSASANPVHTYISAGTFTVTLRITNSNGCTRTIAKPQYMQIGSGVTAGFTNTPPTCTAPVTINFTNTSSGPGSLNYTWNFGDGTGSNLANPVHTYTNPGSYTATLVTVSSLGCRDTMLVANLVSIGNIVSQFTAPATACVNNPITFTNTTSPAPTSSNWGFGDGTSSAQISPVKSYSSPGTYTIKLVNDVGGCPDSITRSITVTPQPAVDFTANQTVSCKVPFTVNFTNQSTGTNTYIWNFGDGSQSSTQNPVHTYTTPGTYAVTLIAANDNECSDTLVKPAYIIIEQPVASLNNLPQHGCNPLTIQPTATIVSNEAIATYAWNFGDGTTSNAAAPTHTYTTAGNYNVSLVITTVGGCINTVVMTDAARVGDKPHANFTAHPPVSCAINAIQFTDLSTGNPDHWEWIFGDGSIDHHQYPLHIYGDTGYFSVTLIVSNNTCADTIEINKIVHILPPVAKFDYLRNCDNKYKLDFIDYSIGAMTWHWNFGDGNTSTEQNPSHTYTSPGIYNVILSVTNDTCAYDERAIVYIVDERAELVIDKTTLCKRGLVNFMAANINPANILRWQWDFGDGFTDSVALGTSHTYAVSGVYTASLIITDLQGCNDTSAVQVTVYGPTAAFSTASPAICLGNSPVLFTDSSKTDGIHPIVKRIWSYGDGTVDSVSIPPYMHLYDTAGAYDVSLIVADNFGCTDTIVKPAAVVISQPRANFHSPDTVSCPGKPVRFISASAGNSLQYEWDFGDGLISTESSPVHFYADTGIYTVSLHIIDQYGCRDAVTKNLYINISLPQVRFTISDSLSSCPPLQVTFTNNSSNYAGFEWNFGDGNTSVLPIALHFYTEAGIYFPRLVVTGPGGCMDSLGKRIEVRGPRGNFSYMPLRGCEPHTVTFTATTLDRISFTWDFSDGVTVPTLDSIISHTYTAPGEYVPKMILSDASGCTVPVVGKDTIRVVGVQPNFGLSSFNLCDSGMVYFRDSTISNDLVTEWHWDFGDGTGSNLQHPSHHYSSAGVYDIKLVIVTQTGCVDSLVRSATINIFPSPDIAITGDSTSCMPGQFDFNGQIISNTAGPLAWQWNLGNGNTYQSQDPPSQLYPSPGTYTVTSIVTDIHGCKDSVVKLINIYPLPNTNAGADTLICLGNSVQLNATGAVTYLWNAAEDLSCTNCGNPTASPVFNIMYSVTGVNEYGCSSSDSVFIRVQQPMAIRVSPGDSICLGESVRLSASGGAHYSWSPATGLNNPNIASPNANPTTSTLYNLIIKDSVNCFTDTAQVFIKVFPIPTVDAGPDQTIIIGSGAQLHATGSADIVSWRWLPSTGLTCNNCPGPVASPRQTTNYLVEVLNDGGCRTFDQLTVVVTCPKGNVFIPNTFSPNGDGINDRFFPRGTGISMVRSLVVYNRWGEIVFEKMNFNANDANAGWDGKYKGKILSPDVYVYTMEILCENNELLRYKGDVTLLQ